MKNPTLILFALLLILTGSCNKDDDDDKSGSTTPPVTRTEVYKVTINGTEKVATTVSNASVDNYLSLSASFADGEYAELEMSPIPPAGNYSADDSRGFLFGNSSTFWVCTSCKIDVQEHDTEAKYIKVSISGQLDPFFEGESVTLNSATVAAFY